MPLLTDREKRGRRFKASHKAGVGCFYYAHNSTIIIDGVVLLSAAHWINFWSRATGENVPYYTLPDFIVGRARDKISECEVRAEIFIGRIRIRMFKDGSGSAVILVVCNDTYSKRDYQ